MKFIFDSNIFDRLDKINVQLKGSHDRFEYFITLIQVEELSEMPDEKKTLE